MDLLSIIFIAFGLSADCFAVALSGSAAMGKVSRFQVVRTALTFGLAQFIMPIIGWLAGRTVVQIISAYDHWVAFGLLAFVGGHMIWDSLKGDDGRAKGTDITRGLILFTLAVATSIDALAVGLSFALLEIGIIQASLIIGVVAFTVTAAGLAHGRMSG
jgi:putative Mn2+ efflux pump MntP